MSIIFMYILLLLNCSLPSFCSLVSLLMWYPFNCFSNHNKPDLIDHRNNLTLNVQFRIRQLPGGAFKSEIVVGKMTLSDISLQRTHKQGTLYTWTEDSEMFFQNQKQ